MVESSSTLHASACHFKGNAAPRGSQTMNEGIAFLVCLLGQYNDIQNGGDPVNASFTGCPKLCSEADLVPRRISSIVNAQGRANPAITVLKGQLIQDRNPAQLGDMSVFLEVLRRRTAQHARFILLRKAALFGSPCPVRQVWQQDRASIQDVLRRVSQRLLHVLTEDPTTLPSWNVQFSRQCHMHWMSCWVCCSNRGISDLRCVRERKVCIFERSARCTQCSPGRFQEKPGQTQCPGLPDWAITIPAKCIGLRHLCSG